MREWLFTRVKQVKYVKPVDLIPLFGMYFRIYARRIWQVAKAECFSLEPIYITFTELWKSKTEALTQKIYNSWDNR